MAIRISPSMFLPGSLQLVPPRVQSPQKVVVMGVALDEDGVPGIAELVSQRWLGELRVDDGEHHADTPAGGATSDEL
jgi:hypothetical protein